MLNVYECASMDVLHALSPEGARPFDRGRDGISIGEGSGVLILESLESLRRRGANPRALIIGAACQVDATSGAQSEARTIAACVVRALEDAQCEQIDYIHAHATGTPQGDAAELSALGEVAQLFNWSRTCVGSSKGGVGHLLHASAFPGVAAALLSLERGISAGTPHTNRLMEAPERLNILLEPKRYTSHYVLLNSFGFGGNNASIILGSPRLA